MLWKEISEDDQCANCPLLKNEICAGGFTCYGGEPVEPPCCNFEDDTDLDEWTMANGKKDSENGLLADLIDGLKDGE